MFLTKTTTFTWTITLTDGILNYRNSLPTSNSPFRVQHFSFTIIKSSCGCIMRGYRTLNQTIYTKWFRVLSLSHSLTHTQIYLSVSSPAGSGRKQCGEFIMQIVSVSGSVQRAASTTWPNLWCCFKKLFTWMDGHMQTYVQKRAHESLSTLSEQASISELGPPRLPTQSKYHKYV